MLLDKNTGALIFVLRGDQTVPQLALRIDVLARRRQGEAETMMNSVVSAFNAQLVDLLGRLRGKLLELLLGKLE